MVPINLLANDTQGARATLTKKSCVTFFGRVCGPVAGSEGEAQGSGRMSNIPATKGQQQHHGGGSSCTVCHHVRCAEFDEALAFGTMSQAEVARAIGCNRSIVSRHVKKHLLPTVRALAKKEPSLANLDVVIELKELYARMRRHLERAEQANNWHAIRAFHAEARQDLELLAKLLGDLQQEGTVNVHLSAEWVQIRTTLMLALAPYPEARAAVAGALLEVER
jgi:hypothetical protein